MAIWDFQRFAVPDNIHKFDFGVNAIAFHPNGLFIVAHARLREDRCFAKAGAKLGENMAMLRQSTFVVQSEYYFFKRWISICFYISR